MEEGADEVAAFRVQSAHGSAMRVLYDISVFMAHRTPRSRAGVYRVALRVARGLAESPECRLSFSAADSILAFLQARDHLAGDPVLRDVPFVAPGRGLRAIRLLNDQIERLDGRMQAGLSRDLTQRLLYRLMREAERLLYRLDISMGGQIDVFHSPSAALPPPIAGRCSPARFLTVYDLIPLRCPHWFEEWLLTMMRRIYGSLGPEDWALAISEATKADLCEFQRIDPARVFVTPLAADPELFYPCTDVERQAAVRRRYGIPEAPYFLSLNTLEPRKNMDHAIRAFVHLVKQEHLDDLCFVLVGAWGWHYERILEAVTDAGGVRDRIILTGYVADEDLAALYSGALGFVYPSLYEGFGLPPLEAMQCGVPVITSNTSSLPEVVGDAGILLGSSDLAGLSHALLQLHDSAEVRGQMAERSLARARLFSWDRCVQQTLQAYRIAVSR
jgi:glycosyltransferase involved in cell wall biosynthesis